MPAAADLSLAPVRDLIAEAIRPAHFFIGPDLRLEWEHKEHEEVSWEIFQGRLLDASQTRQSRCFESWNIFLVTPEGRSTEPLLSVKLDAEAGSLHVIRSIYSYAWEGYHSGENVYLSREVRKWLRELVGIIALDNGPSHLRAALPALLFQAVIGISRLPLSSVEAPLPSFSLGQLAYFFQAERAESESMRSPADLIERALTAELSWPGKAKLLEFLIRSTPPDGLIDAARLFAAGCRVIDQPSIAGLFRTLFQEVSLSPYTDFANKTLAFLRALEKHQHLSTPEHIDFLSWLLRHLGRHLTAYDLVVFHHRGANYPDALLLDAVLGAYLDLAEHHPTLLARDNDDDETLALRKRQRRRALRHGVLFRCLYESHEVPDVPTSPGENSRVLPEPYSRVPEEQITDPGKRGRRLFADDPLMPRLSPSVLSLLQASIDDLDEPGELRELGLALFLDRPLGIGKRPAEPDQSLLLSYEAFSPTVAGQRLRFLAERLGFIAHARYTALQARLRDGELARGIPLTPRPGPAKPGVVSLNDAFKVAPDFILLRSTRRAVDDFLAHVSSPPWRLRPDLAFLTTDRHALVVGGASIVGGRHGTLLLYDGELRLRLELQIDPSGALHPLG